MARHNKKRNVGLVYELLVRRLSKAVVEQDGQKIKKITKIIETRFKPGTELYKEFRLFNAITQTNDVSDSIAFRILDESKKVSQDHNARLLDIEKSRLIKDINHQLNENQFYDTKIENYSLYASAQQLFNSWRSKAANIAEVAKHEETVRSWLVKPNTLEPLKSHKTKGVNNVTVRVMQEKFEQRYRGTLNSGQQELLRLFCEGNDQKLISYMSKINNDLNEKIKSTKKHMKTDRLLSEKVDRVSSCTIGKIESCTIEEVSRCMTLAQLLSELQEFENVKS